MRRPLEGSYWTTVAIVVLALAPDIVVTTAHGLLVSPELAALHTSRTSLEIAAAISNAGYAFGALLGGDLIQRFRQRTLFLVCEPLFILGCVVSATATGFPQLLAGRTLMGLATGLLLVIAVPPLVQRFPASRMPTTAAVIDIGFFGAVCVGPVVGGVVADLHGWRWLYAILAGAGVVAVGLALLSLPVQDPPNPGLRFDATAVGLALVATVLPFLAVAKLQAGSLTFSSPLPVALLVAGVAALVALLVVQYHKEEPLAPVRPLSSTVPAVGTLAAMIGGGAFVAFLSLLARALAKVDREGPLRVGLAFWPQIVGVLVASALVGWAVRTRFLPHLTLTGMVCLVAAGGMLVALRPRPSEAYVLAATGLLGVGAGASVSPGLWLAGMSLPAKVIGRTFALVELVRSVADFVLGPATLKVAAETGLPPHAPAYGLHVAFLATLLFTVAGTLLMAVVWVVGGARAQRPDLEAWLGGDEEAIDSPPPFAQLREPVGAGAQ